MAEIIKASKYADIHNTTEPAAGPAVDQSHNMSEDNDNKKERRNTNFFTWANLRLAVINAVIVAVVGGISVYTTQVLAQQALENKVTTLEALVSERQKFRDDQIAELKSDVNNKLVTREILDLRLKPIQDEMLYQRQYLEKIMQAVQTTRPAPPSQ
jgi:hypothetical protein